MGAQPGLGRVALAYKLAHVVHEYERVVVGLVKPVELARVAFERAAAKLPIKTKFVSRVEG